MKKMIALILIAVMVLGCAACGQKAEEPVNAEPSLSRMRAICELAVMECYYHNVAKYKEEDAVKGFLGIGSKDKHFWIEYDGTVKVGIDVSLINLEVSETEVTVTIPQVKVLGCTVDLSNARYIVDQKSAKIEGADEVEALKLAEEALEKEASNNTMLLESAQLRAQELLENYITNVGDAVGKQYTIKWVNIDDEGNQQESVSEPEEPTGEPAA